MPTKPSNRSLARQARQLRQRPGWNPDDHHASCRQQELQRKIEDGRVAATFDDAEQCPACAEARQKKGDSSALCDTHLRRAMGL